MKEESPMARYYFTALPVMRTEADEAAFEDAELEALMAGIESLFPWLLPEQVEHLVEQQASLHLVLERYETHWRHVVEARDARRRAAKAARTSP
jgi:hypothetical protein